jgi:hypothetical protein
MGHHIPTVLFSLILFFFQDISFAAVRYVKPISTGTGDGLSWTNASGDLQAMINASSSGDEVWVATGTYIPASYPAGCSGCSSNRDYAFLLKDGVSLYGGFTGTEIMLTERNWLTNPTILSGDIGIVDDDTDNTYHVVIAVFEDVNPTTRLDGFTITKGNADGSSTVIINSKSIIQNRGGGIFIIDGTNKLINNTISENSAIGRGGGIYYELGINTITNNTIFENSADSLGGGIFIYNCTNIMTNNTIFENSADSLGGGIFIYSGTNIMTNNTITANLAGDGGGIYAQQSTSVITNSIIWGNNFGIVNDNSTLTVTYSVVQEGHIGTGNKNTNPIFVNPSDIVGPDNMHRTADDGLLLQFGSPAINMGINDSIPIDINTDITGGARILQGTVDIGAYEQLGCPSVTKDTLYVNASNLTPGDGYAWTTAFNKLQDALSLACTCSNTKYNIWVAKGSYFPDEGVGRIDNDRDNSFVLCEGTEMYGGFLGTETNRSQRNWSNNPTILSGDIDDNAALDNNNSYHVIFNNYTSSNPLTQATILDGFTISGGYANGAFAKNLGGGIYNNYSSPTISNCLFIGNYALNGGAMSNLNFSAPFLSNCSFFSNSANFGGGMYNASSSPIVLNSIFASNFSVSFGGAIYNNSSAPRVTNTTFSSNTAAQQGSGMANDNFSAPIITNSILWNILMTNIDEIFNSNSNPLVTYSIIQGGYTGIGNKDMDPLFANSSAPLGVDGRYNTADDGLRLLSGSPAINMGIIDSIPVGITTDITGGPRVQQSMVDMGAYEKSNCSTAITDTLYVNAVNLTPGDGSSWGESYNKLQDALLHACNCPNTDFDVWVAQGTYYPDEGVGRMDNNREEAFVLCDGIKLYGGFDGTETMLSERDWEANVTILSGDIGITGVNTDNAYHVVVAAFADDVSTTLLDGFNITGGNAYGNGTTTINGQSIKQDSGGGIYTSSGFSTMKNNTISRNLGIFGGGIYTSKGFNTIANNLISENFADIGCGIFTEEGTNTIVKNSITANEASLLGGGIYTLGGFNNITNNSISGCMATFLGGGICTSGGLISMTNNTISGNSAGGGGGIFTVSNSDITMTNSIIWGNNSGIFNDGSTLTITYSIIQEGNAGCTTCPGAEGNIDPQFISQLSPGLSTGGNYKLNPLSPAINVGNNDSIPLGINTDITGGPRILQGTVDLGAYEQPNCPIAANDTLYVNAANLTSGDGSTWSLAYNKLQDALGFACNCPNTDFDVWVVQGTYYPDEGVDRIENNRNETFLICDGIKLYGGFDGTETMLSERDWKINITNLSGDLLGDDGPNFSNNEDNSYRILFFDHVSDNTILDGFTITGANGEDNRNGGGIYNDGSGSGRQSNPNIVNSTFRSNRARSGAAIFNDGLRGNSSPEIINCIFLENNATRDGGAIYNFGGNNGISSPTIVNNVFYKNRANRKGGAIFNDAVDNIGGVSSPIILNCTFLDNIADFGGNSLVNDAYTGVSTSRITNSILWGNNEQIENRMATPIVTFSNVQGGYAGMNNTNINPQFIDPLNPTGIDGIYRTKDDGLNLQTSSLLINAGSDDALPMNIITDVKGGPRILQDKIDLGAYEQLGCPSATTDTLYVNASNVSIGDGSTWGTAYNKLQNALLHACGCPNTDFDIWVAQGTYYPDEGEGRMDNSRDETFLLCDGIKLYGGFDGTETMLGERDLTTNVSILSGDIGIVGDNTDNVFHVVVAAFANTSSTARLDGFTVTNGNANGTGSTSLNGENIDKNVGGGVYLISGTNTLMNNTISSSLANFGGAIYSFRGNNSILNNTVLLNSANNHGGGIYVQDGVNSLNNNTISENSALIRGGGIYINGGNHHLESNIISGNATNGPSGSKRGGGIYFSGGENSLLNNIISGNIATGSSSRGGGMYNDNGVNNLINLTLAGNEANSGGDIYTIGGTNTITNSIIWGNNNGIFNNGSALTLSYSIIQGGYVGCATCPGNEGNIDPQFIAPLPLGLNTGGNYRLESTSPAINSGDNTAIPIGITTDIVGGPRILQGNVDMGAYEQLGCPSATSDTLYVNASNLSPSDGSTWNNAYNKLQDALLHACNCPDTDFDVWVAQGTYYPDEGVGRIDNNRDETFVLCDGIQLYGGFSGSGTETMLSERDWINNVTTLSGDLMGDDGPNFTNNADNTHHLVIAAFADDTPTTRLDGFAITRGNASDGNIITINSQSIDGINGGGIITFGGTNMLSNNTIFGNMAINGSGIFTSNGTTTLTNNTISENKASSRGGGIYTDGGTNTLNNNSIFENMASVGGGIYTTGINTLSNNTISGNMAINGGGILASFGTNTLTNNTISGNMASNNGGGIFTSFSTNILTNTIIWGNNTGLFNSESTITISYSIVQEGFTPCTNCPNTNGNIDPLFIAPLAPGLNTGGNYRLQPTSPAINLGNNTAPGLTGITTDITGEPRIQQGVVDMGAYEQIRLPNR